MIHNIKNYKKETPCWIIGGGPSLKPFITDLQSKITNPDDYSIVCTNNAYKIFPEALLCHFADACWWEWNKTLLSQFKGILTTSVLPRMKDRYPDHVLKFNRGERFWLSPDPKVLNGNNSGHQALNLAVHLGFTDIRLLGFDLDAEAQETHWHNDHLRATSRGNLSDSILPGFESILPKYYPENVKITNWNPNSKIKIFPKRDVEQWLQSGIIR